MFKDLSGHALGMIDVAVEASRQLEAARSQIPMRLISLERRCVVTVMGRQLMDEANGILNRHTGALRQLLQHWTGRVA